ncbi:antitoxin [uncultured Jatrophihabitans sp.]|uniref:antitoxin n=1 Tax=uncultured Jatrophihabitans sp. TaxID=1610747 RepID=UPI0035CB12BD
MSEPNFSQRASEFANQAAEAAGPVLARAKVVAGELADKAGPYVEKAAGLAAQGVTVAAGQLDKATSGKYSEKINSVTAKISGTLDRGK